MTYLDEQAVFKSAGYLRTSKILDLSAEIGVLFSLQPFKFRLKGSGFKAAVILQDLKLSALPIPKKKGLNYDGNLKLKVSAHGDLRAPRFSGSPSIKEGFLAPENKDPRDYAFSDFKVDFRYEEAMTDFSAALYRREQKLLGSRARLEWNFLWFLFTSTSGQRL